MAAIGLCACGGSSTPAKKKASTAASKRANSMVALAKCMRANGVPSFPDPGANGGGIQVQGNGNSMTVNGVAVSAPAFKNAMNKCRSDMPQGPPVTAAQIAKIRAGALKMAACMRSHGVPSFQDPVVRAGPGDRGIQMSVGGPNTGIAPNSPAFEQAQRACGSLMGGPRAVSGGKTQASAGAVKSISSSAS
jgi:hypothetical protein